jgi:flavin prenyltransferase
VSGASGTPYAASVLRALLAAGESVDLVVSRASRLTLLDETGISFRDAHWREDLREWLDRGADGKPGTFEADITDVRYWHPGDLAAGPSSGSYPSKGMLIVPASPAFYAGATHIQDLVDFVAGRVLDAAGVGHGLYRRWEGELGGGTSGQ